MENNMGCGNTLAPQVRVGLGVIILRGDKVLVGKRKGSHGAGCWAFPGGHQDFGESWEECSQREIEEETGMEIKLMRCRDRDYAFVTNNIMKEFPKHYCTVFVVAKHIKGEAELREPHSCEKWEWFTWRELLSLQQPESPDAHHWLPHYELEKLGEELGLI
jgi:8-oxo-dGTP diphosphatase